MRNVLLSVVVVGVLIAAGIGGTFAGFVDTELVKDNSYQAGITDLLIDDTNSPTAVINVLWGIPCKSRDFSIKVYDRGESSELSDLYLHFKDIVCTEDGAKAGKVWNGTNYVDGSPVGAGVATSEPELGAEEGNFFIGQLWIDATETGRIMGVDYGDDCEVSEHLGIGVKYFDVEDDGEIDNPDAIANGGDGDGVLDTAEKELAGWRTLTPAVPGNLKLSDWNCQKTLIGKIGPQVPSWILLTVHMQQITDSDWTATYDGSTQTWLPQDEAVDYDLDGDKDDDDAQKRFWPTNALQGDKVTWAMMFELIADP